MFEQDTAAAYRAHIERGDCRFYEDEQPEAAISEYIRAIELDPQAVEAFRRRADVYENMNNDAAAIADYGQIIELQPDDPEAYLNRALRRYRILRERTTTNSSRTDYQQAEAELQRLIAEERVRDDLQRYLDRCPDKIAGLFHRAHYCSSVQWHDQQIADYSEIVRLEPHNVAAYLRRAEIERWVDWEQETDDALNDYEAVIRLQPNNPEGYVGRYDVYSQRKQYELALADINKAIELWPQYTPLVNYTDDVEKLSVRERSLEEQRQDGLAGALHSRAWLYARMGRSDAAEADFNRLVALPLEGYRYYHYRSRRAHFYKENGAWEQALDDYNVLIALNDDERYGSYYDERAEVLAVLGYYNAALSDYNTLVALNPKEAHAHQRRGSFLERIGRYDEALADLERAIQLAPDDPQPYWSKAYLHRNRHEHQHAIACYDQLLRLNHQDSWIHLQRGHAYYWLDRYAKALADYDQVQPGAEWLSELNFWRGATHFMLGHPEEATRDLQAALPSISYEPHRQWAEDRLRELGVQP